MSDMRVISHRGNLTGPRPELENSPLYIDAAHEAGFDVEVDLWSVEEHWWGLGHDEPTSIVSSLWLVQRAAHLWVHCKNLGALHALACDRRSPLNFFWHEGDRFTLTSKGYIWTDPGQPGGSRSVVVDLKGEAAYDPPLAETSYGVCTDYPYRFTS